MNGSKQNILKKLIEGYVPAPPSLEEQAISKLAIQLCQDVELKKYILFQSELCKHTITNKEWDILIEKRLSVVFESLPLPLAFKNILTVRIKSVALQLFIWNRNQTMFNFSPNFADSLLEASDWTIEMRLDEKKIAERLVQDERIPVSQRYKMACMHCLKLFIHSLWDQISPENREDFCRHEESELVKLWSCQLSVGVEKLIPTWDQFWYRLLKCGVRKGSSSTVFQCWDELHIRVKRNIFIEASMAVISMIYKKEKWEEPNVFMYLKRITLPEPYIDIFFFLLTHMSEVQRFAFFQKALNADQNVLVCFIRWPYLDLLIPTIKKLWEILPEAHYRRILLTLANHYSEKTHHVKRKGYVDYDYGKIMIELLKETPDHFKRYVFSNNYQKNINHVKEGNILLTMLKKKPLTIQNIKIFQHILKHVAMEEKRSFLRSENGELFCCHLALQENWDLLNCVLSECIPEDKIASFKKQILRSEEGQVTCFDMLTHVNRFCVISWLDWGFPSKQEIFQFMLKIFFRGDRFPFDVVVDFGIDINCLDNVIDRYSRSEDDRRKFKTQFIKKHSRDVCWYFIAHSKWQEIDQFLTWGFPSEPVIERFKKWFVRKYAIKICEYRLVRANFQDVEQFFSWGFLSVEAVEQFKQELFFFSGVLMQCKLFRRDSRDFDILIKWFKLSPGATLKFKRELFFCSHTLNSIFEIMSSNENCVTYQELSDYMLERTALILRWGLIDVESVMAFKYISKMHLKNFSFSSIEVKQWVQQNWDQLLTDILANLATEGETLDTG